MALQAVGAPLRLVERPDPQPGPGEARLRVLACGVCRTDLHVVDGELPDVRTPIVPGHEVVGVVEALGPGAEGVSLGQTVGLGWLGRACGVCRFCRMGRENLCDAPQFTGYTRDGGFASHVVADARFVYPLETAAPAATAPLMCAGLIGWRTLVFAGEAKTLGLYGFGAAAHIVAQVALWQGRRVFAFTRPGDTAAQAFARELGAEWAGGSDEAPPEPLDAAILYAPVGATVPAALKAVRKGGRVVCGGIHMSDIPSFAYDLLWGERELVSVANLTRADAHAFLDVAPKVGVKTSVTTYPLEDANRALADLREGRLQGAAVLVP
ncbi:MAG TPA: zinc-dependent alcohol dehydrogenase family protein [Caulobacteraceae bacterium]|nr:zinc-dependent alcohol dehydrogenase family protein [Caulobacteraceae bacterium]